MKALIIEDERIAAENLQRMISQHTPQLEVCGILQSVEEAVEYFSHSETPDLVFMDIHLADGLAFHIFDSVTIHCPIIFTTAYDQYALQAFQVNSIDYLLKPIKMSELERALEKFKRWSRSDVMAYLERMMRMRPADGPAESAAGKTGYLTSLLVPVKDKLMPVSLDEVACIYSTDRKTQIYLKTGRMMLYNRSLDSLIGNLDPSRFFRANKQYIVARDCVKEIVVWFDSRLLVRMPVELPEPLFVSKNKAAEFKNWLTMN